MKDSMKDSMGLRLLHMVTSISTRTPNVVFTHAQHILRIVTNVTKALPPSSTSSPLFPLTLSQSLIYAKTQTHTNTPHLVAAPIPVDVVSISFTTKLKGRKHLSNCRDDCRPGNALKANQEDPIGSPPSMNPRTGARKGGGPCRDPSRGGLHRYLLDKPLTSKSLTWPCLSKHLLNDVFLRGQAQKLSHSHRAPVCIVCRNLIPFEVV